MIKNFFFGSLFLLSVGCVASRDGNNGTESFTHDFEEGNLRGWEVTGEAFRFQPTFGDNPSARHRGQPSHHQGKYWIGTYEKYQGREGERPGTTQGDAPKGVMTSGEFVIDMNRISFLIGGAKHDETRVELLVNGKSVLRAHGQQNESMERVVWDVTAHKGQRARIRAADEDSTGWGHLNFDDIRFEN